MAGCIYRSPYPCLMPSYMHNNRHSSIHSSSRLLIQLSHLRQSVFVLSACTLTRVHLMAFHRQDTKIPSRTN